MEIYDKVDNDSSLSIHAYKDDQTINLSVQNHDSYDYGWIDLSKEEVKELIIYLKKALKELDKD